MYTELAVWCYLALQPCNNYTLGVVITSITVLLFLLHIAVTIYDTSIFMA